MEDLRKKHSKPRILLARRQYLQLKSSKLSHFCEFLLSNRQRLNLECQLKKPMLNSPKQNKSIDDLLTDVLRMIKEKI